ncbi:MAG TPA: nitrate ABC transporter permease [Blastocatellia bacterium]|jgi:nitrate/nitrite transport system permease protein|nr:nitrate ABC transporter permease [Blastocatellia bacterium]
MKDEAVIKQSWPMSRLRQFTLSTVLNRMRDFVKSVAFSLTGFCILLVIWSLISGISAGSLPGPARTLRVFGQLLSHPFYDNGPNDKGVGIQLITSIGRVFVGFGLGSVVAIPAGMLIGASPEFKKMFYPLVQLLRPVSPLAWFPLGLAVFKSAGSATIFVIFITSLWPTLINTAFGVASVPDDHRNLARAFAFSKRKYLTKILIPYSLPYILTGLRLSVGVAWLVIVAGEMLSGGIGIGFFVWDSWNALSLERVMSAILLIGLVGLLLDRGFDLIARRFSYE